MSKDEAHAVRGLAFLALAWAGCFWGTGFVFGKIALRQISVAHMILYRFWFACAGLMLIIVWDRTLPSRKDLPLIGDESIVGVDATGLANA